MHEAYYKFIVFGFQMAYPWLEYNSSQGIMVCRWCQQAKKVNSFTNPGCSTLMKDYCTKHAATSDHKHSALGQSERKNFMSAVANTHKKEEAAIRSAFINVFYMAKKNHANSEIGDLNWLATVQGNQHLKHLGVDKHTHYEHSTSVHEFQSSLKIVIDEDIISDIRESGEFSVLIDEMSDKAMDKTLIIYARYICRGQVKVSFLEVVALLDTTSEAIYTALVDTITVKGLDPKNIVSIGTDGASTMTGKHSGVTKRVEDNLNPFVIKWHCMAHRLALAASQAAKGVDIVQKIEGKLNQIFNYFHYSTKHRTKLKRIHELLDSPYRRHFIRPAHTRWLSVRDSIDVVLGNLKPMMVCLLDDANENDAQARGIIKEVAHVQFLAMLHLLADVMAQLGKLSLMFQQTSGDIGSLTYVHAAIDVISNMKETPGHRLESFLKDLPQEPCEDLYLKTWDIETSEHELFATELDDHDGIKITDNVNERKFFQSAKKKFIDHLVKNLKDRFAHQDVTKYFTIFNPSLLPQSHEALARYGNEEIAGLADFFGKEKHLQGQDSVCSEVINGSTMKDEWPVLKEILYSNFRQSTMQECWEVLLQQKGQLETIKKLAKIALLIPANTAQCERGFSRYNLIKTKTRSRLKVSSVSSLLTLAIEGPPLREFESTLDLHKAFKVWANMKQRRILSQASGSGDTDTHSSSQNIEPLPIGSVLDLLLRGSMRMKALNAEIYGCGDD